MKVQLARAAAVGVCLAFGASWNAAQAQDSVTMAPPVPSATAVASTSGGGDASAVQSVFNWKDVPVNQHVIVTRAVFDQGGYQLYASTGETIVVPFVDQNLYVMKFGQTIGGDMYFVNDGTTPTLYVPQDGYLENSAAEGAKWYPFPRNYDYTQPVYEGIAPSWDAYSDMGWYPGMVCYGGYCGYSPWGFGVAFAPMPGFCFDIFGAPYFGWGAYHSFFIGHPGDRLFFHDRPGFRFNGVGARGEGAFLAHRNFAHGSNGAGGGDHFRAEEPTGGTAHAFRTAGRATFGSSGATGRAPFSGGSYGTPRAFSGGSGVASFGSRSLGTSRPFSGGASGSQGGRTLGSGSFGGSRVERSFGGGHTLSGGSSGGGSFGGGHSGGGGGGGGFSGGSSTGGHH